jgi:hypothetical protein
MTGWPVGTPEARQAGAAILIKGVILSPMRRNRGEMRAPLP